MATTTENIGKKVNDLITVSNSISTRISDQEKIDRFLDNINDFKTELNKRMDNVEKLDKLFSRLTWYDLKTQQEEDLVRQIIAKSIDFYSRSLENLISVKENISEDDICKNEMASYRDVLDDFKESIDEVEHIFFSLRKDDEFNNLLNSL